VSCFGEKSGAGWVSAMNGYIINTSNNKKMFDIYHPHSTMLYENSIYYCSLSKGIVYKGSKLLKRFGTTYIRGLDINESTITVGVSSGRRKSRSREVIDNPSGKGKFVAKTGIIVIDKKTGIKKYYDLSSFEKEIYDVLIIQEKIDNLNRNVVGISRIYGSRSLKENDFTAKLVDKKEALENEVLQLRKFKTRIQNSRFYEVFEYLLKLEDHFNKRKI